MSKVSCILFALAMFALVSVCVISDDSYYAECQQFETVYPTSATVSTSENDDDKNCSDELPIYRYSEMYNKERALEIEANDSGLLIFALWTVFVLSFPIVLAIRSYQKEERHNGYTKYIKQMKRVDAEKRSDRTKTPLPTPTVTVEASSEVEFGYYILSVDGSIYGFISPGMTYLALPKGTHYVMISTNDDNNFIIFGSRIVIDNIVSVAVTRKEDRLKAVWKRKTRG